MSFAQSGIFDVQVFQDGSDLFVSWNYSGSDVPTFQVYLNQSLIWFGVNRSCHLPRPLSTSPSLVWVEVATVNSSEATRDYSSQLSASRGKQGRASLSWTGGTYLDATGHDNIAGFLIFQGIAPDQPVDTSTPVDTVPAYPGDCINDGFGKGGFGEAGFGRIATRYLWESPPLAPGLWSFSVVAIDQSGQFRLPGQTVAIAVASAPRPPGLALDGTRLTLKYGGPSSSLTTLSWLPSPSVSR